MVALSNFLSILQSGRQGQNVASQGVAQDPAQVVLEALRRSKTIPLTDVVSATSLRAEDALGAIEKLRKQNLVEVVETKGSAGSIRLLCLTTAGYAALSTTPLAT
jgi:hypothetical protein